MFTHYPSTEQFRHVITSVKRYAEKRSEGLPTLKFIGTVKLHGSNAAIGYHKDAGHWCQSRNNVVTPKKDFEGFAKSLSPVADQFLTEFILPQCPALRKHYESGRRIVLFGEWCGGKIQKNVAIFGLPKMFVIFNVQLCDDEIQTEEEELDNSNDDESEKPKVWLPPQQWSHIKWHEKSIYNIYDFPTYDIDINFECPQLVQNKLIEITESVEEQCPVGSHFNRNGLGEGVVWTEWEKSNGNLVFKVKGEKHSVTKVETLAAVDTVKCENLQSFVNYACTENRMEQGLEYMREQQLPIEMKNFVVFMKWIVGDIVKEEKDTMDASNINSTEVGRLVKVCN
ncbi:hypothetical protein HA402_002602 [Bradysia odoriphaga]|nr:hypothetical protein HA402_002602 [Bradysia odoriphaga]